MRGSPTAWRLALRADIELENHDPADPAEPLGAVFDRASGLDRARGDMIAGREPLLGASEPTPAILGRLQQTGCLDLFDLGRAFREAEHAAIDQAFTDAKLLAELASFADALQAVAGDDVAGLGGLSQFGGHDFDAWGVAVIVRNCVLLRPLVPDGALEAVARAAEEARAPIEAALEISRGLPQYAAFVGIDGP